MTTTIWKCDDLTPGLCTDLQVETGRVKIRDGLSIQYWTYYNTKTADVAEHTEEEYSNKSRHPIVIVNGGGGIPHNYDLPLRQLACDGGGGRQVIFYDQGGSGLSAIPNGTTVEDDYPFLLDVSYLAEEELPALIEHLNLTKFHLVGDSFGTMIAMQFAIFSGVTTAAGTTTTPSENESGRSLVSMTLDSPIPSSKEYVQRNWDPVDGTIGTMPMHFQQRFKEIAKNGEFESNEYEELQQILETHFSVRNGIIPDCYYDAAMMMNIDIHMGMLGPGEGFLNWTGTLQDFDVYPYLSTIRQLPTLLTSGGYDAVRPATVAKMKSMLPLSETVLFPQSGHATIADVTGDLLSTISDFIHRVEEDETNFVPRSHSLAAQEDSGDSTIDSHFIWMGIVAAAVLGLIVGMILGRRFPGRRRDYQQVEG